MGKKGGGRKQSPPPGPNYPSTTGKPSGKGRGNKAKK